MINCLQSNIMVWIRCLIMSTVKVCKVIVSFVWLFCLHDVEPGSRFAGLSWHLTLDKGQQAPRSRKHSAVVVATCEGNLRASRSRRLTGFLPAGNKWPLWLLYPFWAGQGHIDFCHCVDLTVLLFRTFFCLCLIWNSLTTCTRFVSPKKFLPYSVAKK